MSNVSSDPVNFEVIDPRFAQGLDGPHKFTDAVQAQTKCVELGVSNYSAIMDDGSIVPFVQMGDSWKQSDPMKPYESYTPQDEANMVELLQGLEDHNANMAKRGTNSHNFSAFAKATEQQTQPSLSRGPGM